MIREDKLSIEEKREEREEESLKRNKETSSLCVDQREKQTERKN